MPNRSQPAARLSRDEGQERTISDADAECIATHMVNQLVDRLSDENTAERISNVWGGYIDRTLGRGLRRVGLYVIVLLMGVAMAKMGLPIKLGN